LQPSSARALLAEVASCAYTHPSLFGPVLGSSYKGITSFS
jgi:hypothetical protein